MRHDERPSLDALNRTIEGLEARIEGLMANVSKDPRQPREREAFLRSQRVADLIERQRVTEAPAVPPRAAAPNRPVPHVAPAPQAAPVRALETPDFASKDIARALVGLRQELKVDMAESLTREMSGLRAEIRNIKPETANPAFAQDMRDDVQRLSDRINDLGRHVSPAQADALQAEFNALRSMIDGLAREDSVRRMEDRWTGVEQRLNIFDANRDDELLALAHRLDEIKTQISSIGTASPSLRGMEDRLLAVAKAVEALGRQMRQDDGAFGEEFSTLNTRLDEISRAVAVNGRPAMDAAFASRLEDRVANLSSQMDRLAEPNHVMTARLETLIARMDDLAGADAAYRLEERLEQLSLMMLRAQEVSQPDLTGYLIDISQRIDGLSDGSVNDALLARLDDLARRIDQLGDLRQDDTPFHRIEDRLASIAAKLDETQAKPFDPAQPLPGLESLEAQITHLSDLISDTHAREPVLSPEVETRLGAMEEYLTTTDEYIVEAARHAADAVLEAYTRNSAGGASAGDMSVIAGLAEDLRTLERLSRSSDERSTRTFEALHNTLVHIAEKLERLDSRPTQAPMMTPDIAEAGEIDARDSTASGLAGRIGNGRQEPRVHVDPVPQLDASAEMIAPDDMNQLLEPGSGAPDVKKILERLRADERAYAGTQRPVDEGQKADFIAAARRAAQAAAIESDQAERELNGTSGSVLKRHRRPIVMAVGAVLLAIASYPLAMTYFATTGGNQTATVAKPVASPAKPATPTVAKPAPQASAPLFVPAAPPAGEAASFKANDQATTAAIKPAVAIDVPEGLTPESLASAAKSADPLALFEIGTRYSDGRGFPVDMKEAARWYGLSADQGFAPAQYRLASLYEKGSGVGRDVVKAKQLYGQAAEKGNASAMHNLAVLLASGTDGTPDYKAAATWFEKAAELGVRDSQFNLGILYARGNGVALDLQKSYTWFAIAARQGDTDAAAKRDDVAAALKPEQMAAARAQVEAWQAKPMDTASNTADLPDEWVGEATKTASVDMTKAVRNIQAILNNNGFDAGEPDGRLGLQTTKAIKAFQTSIGHTPTGEITDELVRELLKRNKQPG